jgi:deazaflavin-dependent oxidoreductase (nitroreductase family)
MALHGQEHVQRYRATDGEEGRDWEGTEIQVKDQRLKAHARKATPEEKPELWKTMTAEWPAYDDYQESTDRDIPVVVLEPD